MTLLLVALACAEPTKESTCALPEPDAVTVDGTDAPAEGAFLEQGSAYQLNVTIPTGELAGARATLRLQATPEGADAVSALASGDLPVTFALGVAEQGAALWYPPNATESFQAKDDAPGSLTVLAFDGDTLEACFAFTGAPNRGPERVEVEGGVRATAASVGGG
jgi:hypothetical protein